MGCLATKTKAENLEKPSAMSIKIDQVQLSIWENWTGTLSIK
jgi:hypothetical protein